MLFHFAKILSFFIVIFYFSIESSISQNNIWSEENTEWYYVPAFNGLGHNPFYSYTKFRFASDTIIDGKSCKTYSYEREHIVAYVQTEHVSTSSGNLNFATYEEDSVLYIYRYDSLRFDTIVNFIANIGDTWKIHTGPCVNFMTYEDSLKVEEYAESKVIEKSDTVINNKTFNYIELEISITKEGAIYTTTEKFYEQIGFERGFLMYNTLCEQFVMHYNGLRLRCYKQNEGMLDEFILEKGNVACDFLPISNQEEIYEENISIYPNPITNNHFNISFDNETWVEQIKIYDLQGKLVVEKSVKNKIDNLQIPTLNLNTGIYLLQIQGDKKFYNKKIQVF